MYETHQGHRLALCEIRVDLTSDHDGTWRMQLNTRRLGEKFIAANKKHWIMQTRDQLPGLVASAVNKVLSRADDELEYQDELDGDVFEGF